MDDNYQSNQPMANNSQIMPSNSAQLNDLPAEVPNQAVGFNFSQTINSLPTEANDVDLIEKEWVIHLKSIVAQTVGSPHLQQREISLAKADYLRKRYGKEVKSSES